MDKITINAGGTLFQTTKKTLQKAEYFKDLFESCLDINDELFIDRSPVGFEHVLSYLRDQNYLFPTEYLYELRYYGISVVSEEKEKEEKEKNYHYGVDRNKLIFVRFPSNETMLIRHHIAITIFKKVFEELIVKKEKKMSEITEIYTDCSKETFALFYKNILVSLDSNELHYANNSIHFEPILFTPMQIYEICFLIDKNTNTYHNNKLYNIRNIRNIRSGMTEGIFELKIDIDIFN